MRLPAGKTPNKLMGQNFLKCEWVTDTLIASAELTREDTVLEIGPGTGAITRALAASAKKVIAVEKDWELAEALRAALIKEKIENVEIITGDILKFLDYPSTSSGNIPRAESRGNLIPSSYKVVANIPYYLTSRLIRVLLESDKKPETIVLTIQKEVAERAVARPPKMSLLSLSVQAFGKPEIIKIVPASCFVPRPKVDSAILKISDISDRYFISNKLDQTKFFTAIKRAFSQKRKVLLNTLFDSKEDGREILKKLGLSEKVRPEELTLEQWVNIVQSL